MIDSAEKRGQIIKHLEDALALAESQLREARGQSVRIPHEQVRARLGLDD